MSTLECNEKIVEPKNSGYGKRVVVKHKDLCVGCRNCELVCSLHHEKVLSSSLSRIYVLKDLFTGVYEQYTCAQCKNPKCLSACPEKGALTVDPTTGAICINDKLCTGCRECEKACVFASKVSRIKYNKEKNVCIKCDLCGGDPQCVQVCPVNILVYEGSNKNREE